MALVLVDIDIVLEINLDVIIHLSINVLAHETSDDCNTLLNAASSSNNLDNGGFAYSKLRLASVVILTLPLVNFGSQQPLGLNSLQPVRITLLERVPRGSQNFWVTPGTARNASVPGLKVDRSRLLDEGSNLP